MTASSSPAKRTFRHCASHQSAAVVARRGAPPAVASRSSTGLTPSGRAHGSSMENSANGTGREAACIFDGMIAPSPGVALHLKLSTQVLEDGWKAGRLKGPQAV